MTTAQDRLSALIAEEAGLELWAFDPADAWHLGTSLVDRAHRRHAAVVVDIRRPGLILFRAALAGATAENEAWLDRKARAALHFEVSTAQLDAQYSAHSLDPVTAPWFDNAKFAATGGSVPVRVCGVGVVAAVTVSGLTSQEDHDLVMEGLKAHAAERSKRRSS